MTKLNASIVLYCSDRTQVEQAISSFLSTTLGAKLYLVDNSPTNKLKGLATMDERIEYIFNNANLGYGAAHNIAMRKTLNDGVPYHLVLNPDVYFEVGTLEALYDFMQVNPDVGQVMPEVLYPDGSPQYLCKLLPTPADLIFRRFIPFSSWRKRHSVRYELRFADYDVLMDVPALSGCFMFFRTAVLEKSGLFDERFFMYLEDNDITRRIGEVASPALYP